MTPLDVLRDAFGRIPDGVAGVLEGLDDEQLHHRPAPDANPVGWLVWHLLRVQDDHVARGVEREQVWDEQGFFDRFVEAGLPYERHEIGYGHTSEEVGALRVDPSLLREYAQAVHARTLEVLDGLGATDLDRVVDENWDPPVTLGVRLVSVVDDDAQHLGQAAYVRGLLLGPDA
ncbi:mycothiol transferase [Nocardioides nanhaiensis]